MYNVKRAKKSIKHIHNHGRQRFMDRHLILFKDIDFRWIKSNKTPGGRSLRFTPMDGERRRIWISLFYCACVYVWKVSERKRNRAMRIQKKKERAMTQWTTVDKRIENRLKRERKQSIVSYCNCSYFQRFVSLFNPVTFHVILAVLSCW